MGERGEPEMALTQIATSYELDRWLTAIGQGDRKSLELLYHATNTQVYAYALSVLKNPHDAEDAMQDCYVTIFRCAGQYRSQEKPMAWILTITRNRCMKFINRQKKYVSMESAEFFSDTRTNPDDRLMLEKCMTVLTDEERHIVVLHAVAGCKHKDIAQHLGLKTGTVLSKYHRAIKKLKESF